MMLSDREFSFDGAAFTGGQLQMKASGVIWPATKTLAVMRTKESPGGRRIGVTRGWHRIRRGLGRSSGAHGP